MQHRKADRSINIVVLTVFSILHSFWILLLFLLVHIEVVGSTTAETFVNDKHIIDISIPPGATANSEKTDQYFCTIRKLNISKNAVYIDKFIYNFDKKRVHHFLLYGCKSAAENFLNKDYWPCAIQGKGNICSGRKQIPLGLSSGENTDENFRLSTTSKFPSGVAYGIGPKFDINFLLLEVHFIGGINNSEEHSGVTIQTSVSKPHYLAGMLAMTGVGFRIPPHREKFSVDINCQPHISQPIYPYAYWVHTHELGKVVSGYKVDKRTGKFIEIARWTHHWPQPVVLLSDSRAIEDDLEDKTKISISPGDFLAAKCTYDSSKVNSYIYFGRRRKLDEMCNIFIFYCTSSSNPVDLSISCVNEFSKQISENFPNNSDTLPNRLNYNNKAKQYKLKSTTNYSPICSLYKRVGISHCPYD